tara:strand:+ start:5963 stop:6217 length:255 start_codon:yes stop_codon:yes gene_type:complete
MLNVKKVVDLNIELSTKDIVAALSHSNNVTQAEFISLLAKEFTLLPHVDAQRQLLYVARELDKGGRDLILDLAGFLNAIIYGEV